MHYFTEEELATKSQSSIRWKIYCLVQICDIPQSKIAKELGVSSSSIDRWIDNMMSEANELEKSQFMVA